jgi:peptide/nickel transport system substrate-binding protein
MTRRSRDVGVSRRSLLTSLTAGAAATSGCLNRIRTLAGRREPSTVSLSIKTPPVDEDPFAIGIARQVGAWFDAAGIRTSIQPMTAKELYQQVLVNHNFDMFVGQFPVHIDDPDALYPMLHSTYAVERGLQNPFGYTNLLMDDLLERQRRESGSARGAVAADIQRQLVDVAPFTVIGFPNTIRAARTDQFTGWNDAFDPSPVNLLGLNRVDESAETLRATTPDGRPTTNLNPLMASYRGPSDVTDLLYDPLARRHQGTLHPWAAAELTWTGTDPVELEATLREEMLWHDGEQLTAEDVTFTYEFVQDTSMGTLDQTVPALRFRGRSSLVDSVTAVDDHTVRIRFSDCSQSVAGRALTVPLLPEHVWSDRTGQAELSGVDVGATTTEALVTDAVPPVGSGPMVYEAATPRQQLVLERYEDHFLHREGDTDLPSSLAGGAPFERFELQFVGSDASSVDLIANGDADASALGVGPDLTDAIGDASDVSLQLNRSPAFYIAGFNTRRSPLTNPRFRALLSRLIDRATLAASVFDGYVEPTVSPLSGTTWLPTDLSWSQSDRIIEFLGHDGIVDVEAARDAFRAAGYRYNEQGRLIQ